MDDILNLLPDMVTEHTMCSIELHSSMQLTPMTLTACSYHGCHRLVAEAYTQLKNEQLQQAWWSVVCSGCDSCMLGFISL